MGNDINVIYHALNAGEVSARFVGRQDQNKYLAACETMFNFLPLVLGGAYVRPGTQFVASAKSTPGHPEKRLIEFVPNYNEAYVLEFGHEYIRFFRNGARLVEPTIAISATTNATPVVVTTATPHGYATGELILIAGTGIAALDDKYWLIVVLTATTFELASTTAPGSTAATGTAARVVELATPYDSIHLGELFTVESVDVMYLLHRFYPVHKITRITATSFTITEVNFDPPALLEEEPTGADLGMGTLTPAATTGLGVSFTAASGGFLAGDVGRLIISGGSRATITSVPSSTVAVADIIDDFESTAAIAAADWSLRLSPQVALDIAPAAKEIGQYVTLTVDGLIPAFRSRDAGHFLTIFGGTVRITSVDSSTQVTGIIRARLKDITVDDPDPTRAWGLEVPAWSATLGYPSCGCFFQERFWLCKGLTVNGSKTNDFENFAKGADADDAIARTISDDDVDSIVWIKAVKTLKIGTGSGIFEISATAQNGALTPSSFKAEPIDPNGGARVEPVRIAPVLIYIQRGLREVRELSYTLSDDAYKSPKLFRLSDHLNDGYFFPELHASADPDNYIIALRNDGVICACIYEQVENVIGWARIQTRGEFKSFCAIPRPETGKDWWWVLVSRESGLCIEYFEPDHPTVDTGGRGWNDLHTDSAVIAAPSATGVITGLDHLEGETVWILGDGCLYNFTEDEDTKVISSTAVVTGGQVTLDLLPEQPLPELCEVGLDYPAIVVPVEPIVPAEAGGPFIARYYANIGIRIRRALGLSLRGYYVNITDPGASTWLGERLAFRKPFHIIDEQVPLQRGKKCIINAGEDPFSRIEVAQRLPFPAEITNVAGKLHTGDQWRCETYGDEEILFLPPFVEPPDVACPDSPGAQALSEICCYDSNGFGDLTGNDHGMLSHVDANYNFWHVATLASGFGSGPYPIAVPTRTWYLLEAVDPDGPSCALQEGTPVSLGATTADFQSTQTPQGGVCGPSDERSYLVQLANINPSFLIDGIGPFTNIRAYFGESSGVTYFHYWNIITGVQGGPISNAWCKFGSHIYAPFPAGGFGPNRIVIASYPVPALAGTFQDAEVDCNVELPGWDDTTMSVPNVYYMHATTAKLYILAHGAFGGGPAHTRLYRLTRSSMTYEAHWSFAADVNFPSPWGFFAANDNLLFLIQGDGGDPFRIGYIELPSGNTFVIDEIGSTCTDAGNPVGPPGQSLFYYRNGYFFLSYSGFGLGKTNVLKIGPLVCPSDPGRLWG